MEFENNDLDEILLAHLQKEEKVSIYKTNVLKNIINGFVNFKATWSWWAFFGTWAFFLYRKMYLQAGIFFVLSILLSSSSAGILLMIASGVSAFYFYTKKLESDLKMAGYKEKELNVVLENLKSLGGFHSWVIWVGIILNLLLIILVLFPVFLGLSL